MELIRKGDCYLKCGGTADIYYPPDNSEDEYVTCSICGKYIISSGVRSECLDRNKLNDNDFKTLRKFISENQAPYINLRQVAALTGKKCDEDQL